MHGLSPEEARAHLVEAQGNAEELFSKTSKELLKLLENGDPPQILANVGFLFFGIQLAGSAPNAVHVNQHHVELLQAMALRFPLANCRRTGRVASHVQEAVALLNDNAQAFQFRRVASFSDESGAGRRAATREQVRGDTQFVRGEFHAHQTERYLGAILKRIDDAFQKIHGIKATTLQAILLGILTQIESQLNDHIKQGRRVLRERKAGKAIRAYFSAFPEEEPNRNAILLSATMQRVTDDLMHQFLWEQTSKFLPRAYSVGLADIASLCPEGESLDAAMRAMEGWALGFGDLADHEFDHLYLANPVWARPFIGHDGLFLLPSPGTLLTFMFAMFEQMIEPHADLKIRYEDARAEFLEDELARLLRQYFPSARVLTSLRWTSDIDGKGYENDALVLIDRTALLFEAKSGRVTAPARRGADARLKSEINKLMVEPAQQSQRLEDLLRSHRGVHRFDTDNGVEEVDASRIDAFVRVNITLNTIGAISSRWPELAKIGLIPPDLTPVPTMSVADLEVIGELLPAQTDICHYLQRRTDFERNATYLADEYDLTAFYLRTGFNVGDTEFDDTYLHLYGMSDDLTAYYSRNRRRETPKPAAVRTAMWRKMLKDIEARQSEHWIEIAYRLLNVDLESQNRIEEWVPKARREVMKTGGRDVLAAELAVGPPQRRSAIVFVIFKSETREERDKYLKHFAAETMENAGVDNCLFIGIDARLAHMPYSVSGLVIKPSPSSKASEVALSGAPNDTAIQ